MKVLYTAAHGGFAGEHAPLGGGAAIFEMLSAEWAATKPFDLVRFTPQTTTGHNIVNFDTASYARFSRQFEAAATTAIQQHNPNDTVVLVNDIAAIYCRGLAAPETLVKLHRIFGALYPDLLQLIFQKQSDCVQHCAAHIVPSHAMKEIILRCYPQTDDSKTHVIPWGAPPALAPIDKQKARELLQIPEDALVLITLSRLSPEKNQQLLLDALAAWEHQPGYPKIFAFLCGGAAYMHGKKQEKLLRAKAANLAKTKVVFPGLSIRPPRDNAGQRRHAAGLRRSRHERHLSIQTPRTRPIRPRRKRPRSPHLRRTKSLLQSRRRARQDPYSDTIQVMLLRLLPLLALPLLAQRDWDDPFPPHRIAGNLYYVGSKGLSTYLVTGSQGHILINASFERTVPIIRANVEKLGFKLTDVKILLSSHAHGDHAEGLALLQELTGAKVFVMAGDNKVTSSGNSGQWKPCKVDKVLKDGDTVEIGEAKLRAHLTPGHTRGNTTWTLQVDDEGKTLNAVIIGSPNVNPGTQLVNNKEYPEIATDFARTFRVLKSLQCDLFLGAHGDYYGMAQKHKRIKPGSPNPFVDPTGYREYIDEREQYYLYTLEKQQKL